MPNFTITHFGPVDPTNIESYQKAEIQVCGNCLALDLNFDKQKVDVARLEAVNAFLGRLEALLERNQHHIRENYNCEDDDSVRFYLEMHLEELPAEDLDALFDENSEDDTDVQLMKRLKPVRLGVYPDSEDLFALFDYSFGEELTNYLLVIQLDEEGRLINMTVES